MDLKNIVMTVAIIILTIFVTIYGINTFYAKPEYSDFCDEFKTAEVIETPERCEEIGGMWNVFDGAMPRYEGNVKDGYCDRYYTCRQEYDKASEIYSKNVFLIAIPLGILIIALGAFFFSLESVGAGLMGGGVGTLLFGVGGYWRYAENWMRFVMSLLGLVVLIWMTYYFNERFKKKKKKKR